MTMIPPLDPVDRLSDSDMDELIRDWARPIPGRPASLGNGRPHEEIEGAPEPLFQLEAARFGRFLRSDPPPRRYILNDVLPIPVAGLLAAMGGAGKSGLIYQLAMSVVTGLPCLGLEVGETGSALFLAGEDDEDELHRRGRILLDHLTADPVHREMVAERLYVVSRVAENNLLTAGKSGEVMRTPLVGRLIDVALQIPDLKLIAIDPKSRFAGGNANTEDDATRYVEAKEEIREATGATVISSTHVSQSGIKEGGGQEIVRGSTALVDGSRWVATLQRLRRDAARDYGLSEEDAPRYLRFEVPKSNYTPPFSGMWLRRDAGGVLVPTTLERQDDARKKDKSDREYLEVIGRVQGVLRAEPLTLNRLEGDYAGTSGLLGVGQKALRGIVQRALHSGDLIRCGRAPGGGELIGIPGGDA